MSQYPDGGLTRHTIGLVFAVFGIGAVFAYKLFVNGWASSKHEFTLTLGALALFALWGYSDEAHERHDKRLDAIEKRLADLESKMDRIGED